MKILLSIGLIAILCGCNLKMNFMDYCILNHAEILHEMDHYGIWAFGTPMEDLKVTRAIPLWNKKHPDMAITDDTSFYELFRNIYHHPVIPSEWSSK